MVIMHNMLAINANRMYGINGRSRNADTAEAGQAVLAQANLNNLGVLTLLR